MTPYENKTIKDSIHEERQKLKNMSLKNRAWYIWEYYKIPIIGIVTAVVLLSSIGFSMYQNRFDTALSCVILNSLPTTEQPSVEKYLDQDFRLYAKLPEDEKISVDYSMNITFEEASMSEFTYAELAKLTAMISSKELDVMIGKPEVIDHYGAMGGFLNLEECLPPDLYETVKDRLYTVQNQETGEAVFCGLLLDEEDFASKTGLSMEKPILCVMKNSTHTDTAVKLIRYMLMP